MVAVNVAAFEIEVRTGHGDLVRADVYLPKGAPGQVPVLLGASPYQKSLRCLPGDPTFPFIEYGPIQLYLDEGYAYVALDVPGMGRSDGTWDFVSRAEGEAIHDMIEHVAIQPWSTDNIGMIGMSYYCWSQWNTARTHPPHLRTIAPFDDAWQRRRSPFWELDQVDIPVLSIGAWGKASLHLRGNFEGFRRVQGPKQLLIVGTKSFAETQLLYFKEEFHRKDLLPWYDHHLKGVENGVMNRPKVRFVTQGEDEEHSADARPIWSAAADADFLSGQTINVDGGKHLL